MTKSHSEKRPVEGERSRAESVWGWSLDRLKASASRVRRFVATVHSGPTPWLEETGEEPRPAVREEVSAGGAQAQTIVPSARWDKLAEVDDAPRPSRRRLAQAGVCVALLLVSALALRAVGGGDAPPAAEWSDEEASVVSAMPEPDRAAPAEAPRKTPRRDYGGDLLAGISAVAFPDEEDDQSARVFEAEDDSPAERMRPAAAVTDQPEPPPAARPRAAACPSAEGGSNEDVRRARSSDCPDGALPTRVLPGDTIETIAWRHSPERVLELAPVILAANGDLRPERIRPGDMICIPGVARVIVDYDREVYTIRRNDTVESVAERFPHLTRANVRAMTTGMRKQDTLLAGARVDLLRPRYATAP